MTFTFAFTFPLFFIPPPTFTSGDIFLTVAMALGLTASLAFFVDALLDRRAVATAKPPLLTTDPRRPLANGLLIASIGYTLLKLVCFYIALSLLYDFPHRAHTTRYGLATAMILCDLCIAIFTWMRKRGLPSRRQLNTNTQRGQTP